MGGLYPIINNKLGPSQNSRVQLFFSWSIGTNAVEMSSSSDPVIHNQRFGRRRRGNDNIRFLNHSFDIIKRIDIYSACTTSDFLYKDFCCFWSYIPNSNFFQSMEYFQQSVELCSG